MCALKKGGVRFSVMNRAGENETPAARLRTVHSIELQNFQPPYFTISKSQLKNIIVHYPP